MTEFGAVDDDPSSVRLLEKITRAAEARLQSWFYWTYRSYGDITTQNSNTETFFHQNGTIQYEKIKHCQLRTRSLLLVFHRPSATLLIRLMQDLCLSTLR